MIATVVLALRFALAIALYAFLGWALLKLFQDLRQQGNKLSAQRTPGVTIFVKIDGVRDSRFHFLQTEIMIGRDANCDVAISDEALSAHHARLAHHHGQWWLEDLNSRNGTFLNREKMSVPAVVITGDQFKCGNTFFDLRIDDLQDKAFPAKTP